MAVDNGVPEDKVPAWITGGLGILAGLPVPGLAAIATAAAASIEHKQRERDLEWMAMTNVRLSALEDRGARVNPEDEEFVAIVSHLQRAAAETADREKRIILAQAAANSGSWSTIPYDQREEYASLAAALLPIHIRVLVAIDRATETDASTGGFLVPSADFSWVAAEAALPQADARRVADNVQQRGLGFAGGAGPADRPRISEFGRGFLEYLRAPSHGTIRATEAKSG